VVGSGPEVVQNFTWAVLVMKDGNFFSLGGVTRWNFQFLIHTSTFLAIIYVALRLFLGLFGMSLRLGIGVYITLASKICGKLLKPSKIHIPTPITSFQIC
jgi:hypothetical protein